MGKLEECVRSVQVDGLLWGASKLVPVGYGIKKLQINCVVEDDKVGTDFLEEEITKFEDYVSKVLPADLSHDVGNVTAFVFITCLSLERFKVWMLQLSTRSKKHSPTITHYCCWVNIRSLETSG